LSQRMSSYHIRLRIASTKKPDTDPTLFDS